MSQAGATGALDLLYHPPTPRRLVWVRGGSENTGVFQNMGSLEGLGEATQGHTGRAHMVCSHSVQGPWLVRGPRLVILPAPQTGSLPVLSALAAAHPLCTHHPPGQESGATLVLASGGGARHGHSWLASPVLVACPHGVDCSCSVAFCDRLECQAVVCVLGQVYSCFAVRLVFSVTNFIFCPTVYRCSVPGPSCYRATAWILWQCLSSAPPLARPRLYVTVISLVPHELHVSVSHQAGFTALPVCGGRLDATWNASCSMVVLDGSWHATDCEAAMEVL